jgi:indolepyruvate ferredoxin oxidoreductase beta subunit
MNGIPAALDVVIVGVGGQGTLLASRVLGGLATRLGYDVKVSEVHGMSQRGGSVITYVRMGKRVRAPLVEQGGADFALAFEELEALRALPSLKPGGVMIMNTQRITPLPVLLGAMEYPAGIAETIASAAELVAVGAMELALRAGSGRAVNTVLLGVLAARLPFERGAWLETLRAAVPPRFLEANLSAFDLGFALK